jgi:hypothetical protein
MRAFRVGWLDKTLPHTQIRNPLQSLNISALIWPSILYVSARNMATRNIACHIFINIDNGAKQAEGMA